MTARTPVRATLVFNPQAGAALWQPDLEGACDILRENGWDIRIRPTERRGQATDLAHAAAERGDDVLIVAGGDGTINEAIQGLACSETALAVFPTGSVNVWAREIGMPLSLLSLRGAAKALLDAEWRASDLGKVDGRYFLLMAGVGFDADVAGRVSPRLKKALGVGAYAVVAAHQLMHYRGADMTLEMDEESVRCRATLVVVSNTRLYGGVLVMSPTAVADDGLFDVVTFSGRHVWQSLPQASAILLRQYDLSRVTIYQTSHLRIVTNDRLPVQLDGEHIGRPDLDFDVVPAGLKVLVPARKETDLFQAEPE